MPNINATFTCTESPLGDFSNIYFKFFIMLFYYCAVKVNESANVYPL